MQKLVLLSLLLLVASKNTIIEFEKDQKIFIEINQVGKELVDAKNLILELKNRINSLNLRIDGKKAYNSSGILIKGGKEELE